MIVLCICSATEFSNTFVPFISFNANNSHWSRIDGFTVPTSQVRDELRKARSGPVSQSHGVTTWGWTQASQVSLQHTTPHSQRSKHTATQSLTQMLFLLGFHPFNYLYLTDTERDREQRAPHCGSMSVPDGSEFLWAPVLSSIHSPQ